MTIEDYYKEFLNHEVISREYYSLGKIPKPLHNIPSITMKRLLKHRTMSNQKLFYTTPFFKDGAWYYDRLFFDFDIEQNKEEYKSLKTSESARDMLFNTNMIDIPFYEVSKLYDSLKDGGYKPYLIFSSSKGFHCYCFFDAIPLVNYGKIMQIIGGKVQKELNLTTMDFNVFTNKRQARLPYSKHNKTDLFVTPCNVNSDVEDILYESINPPIKEFAISDYIVKGLSDELMGDDAKISEMDEIDKRTREEHRRILQERRKDVLIDGYIDFSEIDGCDVIRSVASSHYVKTIGGKDIYLCPFHDDNSHSAYCYHNTGLFGCSVCGFKPMTFYQFISEFYDLTEPNDIINVLKMHIGGSEL